MLKFKFFFINLIPQKMIPPLYVFTLTMKHRMIFQIDSWLVVDKQFHFLRFDYLEHFEQHLYPCCLTSCIWCIHVLNFTRLQSHSALLSRTPWDWDTSNHEYVARSTLIPILISTKIWINVAIYLYTCVGILFPRHYHTMINRTFNVSQHFLDCC